MAETTLPSVIRTLLVNGYIVTEVSRISARVALLSVRRRDALGGVASSTLLLAANPPQNVVQLLKSAANQNSFQPLILTRAEINAVPTMDPDKFFQLLGGEVRSDRVTRDDLVVVLDQLGRNKLPVGMTGSADDLLEDYVKEGLEFLLNSRGWRYGQDRLFESLPDGLILSPDKLNIYFDGKAYEKGYHPTADDIKRFAAYTTEFNERYSVHVGRLHAFLVVTGKFSHPRALQDKANEFYGMCATQLCFLTGEHLGRIVADVRGCAGARSAIAWRSIFSRVVIEPKAIANELRRISKDKIVRG